MKPKRPPTAFEKKVYAAARRIPRGRVTTYALLGKAIGCGSSRAVGQALRRNPFAPKVPCHRIIRSDLTLGGFGGRIGGERVLHKLELLLKEGVPFKDDTLADPTRLFRF